MDVLNKSQGLASIRFLTGPLAGNTRALNKPMVTIGREPTNDIVVSDPSVSRQHARLVNNNGRWFIEKLAPQNVLTLNSRDVQQAPISDRDTIGLGTGTTFLFSLEGQAAQPQQASYAPAAQSPLPPQPAQQYAYQTVAVPPPSQVGAQQAGFISGTSPVGPPSGAGIPTLEVSSNIHADKQTIPINKPVINIGRDPSNELVVSGFHAQVVREGNQLVFIHPHPQRGQTLNGIIYQGRHIPGNQQFRKVLTRGDFFRIGDEHGTLVTIAYNDGSGAAQEALPEMRPIPLGAPVLTLGRLPDNTVVLNHPQVSGHHARLEQIQGGYRVVDLNSTNHVYVNGQRISNQALRPGDEIRIGPFKLLYTGTQLTQHDESGGVRIDALHLVKEGNNSVILLDDISIAIPPRKFVALVGGSGAGKSTLMDALNGLRPAHKGLVLYNGRDYYKNLAAFSTQLGYVPQDDIIHRDLTVERALYYTAKMRLPDDFTEEQIQQRIDEVLDDVEMKFRRKLLVSKLSGGQRKRVSIALELLANPSVFFLDEPTSGLDPGLDRKMMFLLRKLADKGHTIVLVTHATNNINACDYVCFLAQGGHLAFFGPPNEAKTYFGKNDFAEIYSSLEPTEENPNIPDEAEARSRASQEYQDYVVRPLREGPAGAGGPNGARPAVQQLKRPKRGNPFKQFALLSQRNLELLFNDRANLIILLLQAPLIALLLMLLIRSQVGVGIFDANNVVQCAPRITTTLVKSPTGFVGLTSNVGNNQTVNCNQIKTYLQTDPLGKQYVTAKGKGKTVNDALQDFIVLGNSINAERALFIIAFVAVLFGCINGTREVVKEAAIYRRERTVNLGIVPYILSKVTILGVLALFQSAMLLIIVQLFEPLHQGIFLPVILETYITLALTALAGLMIGLTASA